MSRHKCHVFNTPAGWIGLLGNHKGLARLSLKPTPEEALADLGEGLSPDDNDPTSLEGFEACLKKFLSGDETALDGIGLDLSDAPPFFSAAWSACRSIPFGETRTYAWLAAKAGRPLAVRAAGQAMAKNRFPLIIPCHRVIASSGDLGGYGAGGPAKKASLLEWEKSTRAAGAQAV